MKKRNKLHILLVIFTTIILGVSIIATAYASSNNSDEQTLEPHYKLNENIQQVFRPEWIWNEAMKDYENTGELIRDSNTGLFPEPKDFPEQLVGYAHWDAHLGLYIINSVEINHKTGEIIENPLEGTISIKKDWPEYNFNKDDEFDVKYSEYIELVNNKYIKDSSLAFAEMYIIEKEKLSEEWFGLEVTDLPMLFDKLESGAPTSYSMSMIMLVSKINVGFNPSIGASRKYIEWVNAYNEITANAEKKIEENSFDELGYLALPIIYEQLKSGNTDMLEHLADISSGLYNAEKAEVKQWGSEQWIDWFETNYEIMDALKYAVNYEIKIAWLE